MAIESDAQFVTTLPGGGDVLAFHDEGKLWGETPVLGYLVYTVPAEETAPGGDRIFVVYPASWERVYEGPGWGHGYLIIHPNGGVDEPDGLCWGSVEECEQELTERHEKSRAEERAKKQIEDAPPSTGRQFIPKPLTEAEAAKLRDP